MRWRTKNDSYQVWSLVRIWQGFEWASCFYWLHNDCYGHWPIMVTGQGFCPSFIILSPSPQLLFLVFASLVSIYFFSIYDRIFICTETEKAILCKLVYKDKSWQTSVMDFLTLYVILYALHRDIGSLWTWQKFNVLSFCHRLKIFSIIKCLRPIISDEIISLLHNQAIFAMSVIGSLYDCL